MQFDYIFVVKSKILLTKELNYEIFPFGKIDVLYFSYNGVDFVKTDSFDSNMISMKYHKDIVF